MEQQEHETAPETKSTEKKEKLIFPKDDAGWESEGYRTVNPPVFFYRPSSEDGDRIYKHTMSGIVLARAKRAYTDKDRERDQKEGRRQNANRYFYLVALTRPCVLFNHEKEKIDAGIGTIAWVDERFNLAPLATMLPILDKDGKRPVRVTEVVIQPDKKVATGSGNNVWKFRLRVKEFAANNAGVPLLSPAEATSMVQTAESYAASRVDEDDEPNGQEHAEGYNDRPF